MAGTALPSRAIPGTSLGPVSHYSAGPGTHIHHGQIIASLLGQVTVALPLPLATTASNEIAAVGPPKRLTRIQAARPKSEAGSSQTEESLPVVSVVRHDKTREVLPEVGNTVLARVVRLMPRQAIVSIQQVGDVPLQTEWQGVIRAQDVRATEIDRVKIHESFRPGDVVQAQVISLGDQANYYLSTALNELGVIMATSEAGNEMIPLSWKEFRDPVTERTELRKVAKP